MTTVTLLTAHPSPESFNTSLALAWKRGAEQAGARVEQFDVCALQFDPVLRHAYRGRMEDEPDLARVRDAFERSSHVTWSFPTWWVGLPAALKALVDRLLLPGWAFKFEGGALPKGLLAGRSTRYLTTMDSPGWWYRLAQHDAMGGSFSRGTLAFVGFKPVERTVFYDVRRASEGTRKKWLAQVEREGARDIERLKRRPTVPLLSSEARG